MLTTGTRGWSQTLSPRIPLLSGVTVDLWPDPYSQPPPHKDPLCSESTSCPPPIQVSGRLATLSVAVTPWTPITLEWGKSRSAGAEVTSPDSRPTLLIQSSSKVPPTGQPTKKHSLFHWSLLVCLLPSTPQTRPYLSTADFPAQIQNQPAELGYSQQRVAMLRSWRNLRENWSLCTSSAWPSGALQVWFSAV